MRKRNDENREEEIEEKDKKKKHKQDSSVCFRFCHMIKTCHPEREDACCVFRANENTIPELILFWHLFRYIHSVAFIWCFFSTS